MFVEDTKEKLTKLRLKGMMTAFEEQVSVPDYNELSFEERLGALLDKELFERENRRLKNRLKQAKLKDQASIENIDFKKSRGIEKQQILSLANCQWINLQQNIVITGATGTGKTFLANAFAHKACREGFSAVYYRINLLLEELSIAKVTGSYLQLHEKIKKFNVLILDDFGLSPLTAKERNFLLDLIDERHSLASTILVTQIPQEKWFELIGDQTIADAIFDRLLHNSHSIKLKGESMRKNIANKNINLKNLKENND